MNRRPLFRLVLAAVAGLAVSSAGTASVARILDADFARKPLWPGVKTPETSKLFVEYVDPTSGVVSYLLRPGLIEDSHRQLYFTSKSMTEDGRFLVVNCACNEYAAFDVYRPKRELKFAGSRLAVVDMLTETVHRLYDIPGQIPFLDVDNDELFYARFDARDPSKNWLFKRELLKDPTKEIPVCRMPEELTKGAKRVSYYCHLTLSGDRTLAFLDSRVDDDHVQGVLNLTTGAYTKWHDAGLKNISHGQINPLRNDIALCCWECVPWTDSKGVVHDELRNWPKKHPTEPYPRLQLCEPGKLTMVPATISRYATHERWDEQGEGFYWCAHGVYYHDLATGEQTKLSPIGTHAFLSRDRRYVVADNPVGGWWRGCAWQVYFHNRETDRGVYLFARRPAMCTKKAESRLHPDPHPQFVCGDRYVICTINHADGHMDYAVTPVADLVKRTSHAALPARRIFCGDAHTAYRDPAAVWADGRCHLFFTLVETEADGAVYSYVAQSESADLQTWTPPRKITPKSDRDYSSPGNVVRDGADWVLCCQSYPRPGNRDDGKVRYADETARLFVLRSADLRAWSRPELLRVKGPDVPEAKMGRMIDPYLVRTEKGWLCYYKQNGASVSRSPDLKTWEHVGRTAAGENVCVVPVDGRYAMIHSPKNGMRVKTSDDLLSWQDRPGQITLGQAEWPWARGRLTAGFALDGRKIPGVGKWVMFFHGSGPRTESEGDFDRNASLGLAFSETFDGFFD